MVTKSLKYYLLFRFLLCVCVRVYVCVCLCGHVWVLVCFLCVYAAQLEAALGVFYAPPVPLPDAVVLVYREPISSYARRFFHHLIRYPCISCSLTTTTTLHSSLKPIEPKAEHFATLPEQFNRIKVFELRQVGSRFQSLLWAPKF